MGKTAPAARWPWRWHSKLRTRPLGQRVRTQHKSSEITLPAPTQAFVFADERGNAIEDAVFDLDVAGFTVGGAQGRGVLEWRWLAFPATRHNGAGNISFADGHVKSWRWRDPNVLDKMAKNTSVKPLDSDRLRFLKAMKPYDEALFLTLPEPADP